MMRVVPRVVNASQLSANLVSASGLFVGWSGFEERSVVALRALKDAVDLNIWEFYCEPLDYENDRFRKEFKKLSGNRLKKRQGVDRSDQFSIRDAFKNAYEFARANKLSVTIDISAIPRDILLVAIGCLYDEWSEAKLPISLIYNFAVDYDYKQHDVTKKWLSKGIGSVSTVLGFTGKHFPGRSSVLIALVGFDSDRLLRSIDKLGVENVVLGFGITPNEERKWLEHETRRIGNALSATVKIQKSFEFDCNNLIGTIRHLLDFFKSIDEENILLMPLNNKISTVAVALACLMERRVQIVYAPGVIYNVDGHTRGGDQFWVFDDFPSVVENFT